MRQKLTQFTGVHTTVARCNARRLFEFITFVYFLERHLESKVKNLNCILQKLVYLSLFSIGNIHLLYVNW